MGLSDFHKMVVSVLKHTLHRSAPKELVYRDYKSFDRKKKKKKKKKIGLFLKEN